MAAFGRMPVSSFNSVPEQNSATMPKPARLVKQQFQL